MGALQATHTLRLALLLCCAARLASGACSSKDIHANSCIHDAKARIGPLPTLKTASAAACCSACSDNRDCKAWTFYDGSSCNLFTDAGAKATAGHCSSSVAASPVPPPSSPWVPPVAPGPACTDCPNIIFCLTDE